MILLTSKPPNLTKNCFKPIATLLKQFNYKLIKNH